MILFDWRRSLGIVLATVGLIPFLSQAATVNDSYISSVAFDSASSTTLGASGSYTVSFTNSQTMSSGTVLYVYVQPTAGCAAPDYADCYPLINGATVSGLSGTVTDSGSDSVLALELSADVTAGTHTVTVSGITNPSAASSLRAYVVSLASDEQTLLGDEYNDQNWYATSSPDVQMAGTPLVYGTVTDTEGNGLGASGVYIHTSDWTAYSWATTDIEGYYSVFQDYFSVGYWPAGEVIASVYPASDSGYIQTDVTFTFDGSQGVETAVAADPSIYFFSGTIIYGDNSSSTAASQPGDPVTNANVYFSPSDGGSGFSAVTDEQGEYTVAVRPGTYYLSLSLDSSDENQDQDWIYNESESYTISDAGTVTADAQVIRTTAKLHGSILTSDNEVIQGTFTVSNSTASYSAYTDADGAYTMHLNPGTYTTTFYPNTSSHETARYFLPSASLNVSEGNAKQDYALSEKTSSLVVSVVDEDGNAIADASINAWQEDESLGSTTDETGQVTFWLQSGEEYEVYPWSESYIYNGSSEKVSVKANASEALTFTLLRPDASISVNVVDSDGQVPEAAYGYVSCFDEQHYFGGSVINGLATISVLVDDETGTFAGECQLWMSDETLGAAEAQEVSVADGETGSVQFTLVARSATVVVYVKDLDGKLVKNVSQAWVNVWNAKSSIWQGEELDESGKTTLHVVPGTYVAGVWFEGNDYIPLWNKNNGSTKVAADESGKIVLTVVKASATLSGKVTDPNGDPVTNAWVYCSNWEEVTVQGDFDGGQVLDSGAQVTDGSFNMPIVGGHTYRCNVGLPQEFVDQGWLSPEDQSVTVAKDGSSSDSLTFQFTEADSKIKGSVSQASSAGTIEATKKSTVPIWCWAWGDNGGHSYADASDGSFALNVQSGEVWHYGCDSQDGESWLTTGDTELEITEAGVFSNDLTLKAFDSWTVYSPMTTSFEATENTVINLDDGTVLTIPANAIATSGQVTITATPETSIVHTSDEMLGIPWNFEAFVGGELVETFNSDVTIEIPYTNKTLDEFGVDEDALISKYYDESTGTWITTQNVTQNKKTNTITVTTNHFTQYGVTFNAKLTSGLTPKTPSNLSVTDRAAHSIQLNWEKTGKKKVKTYVVQVRERNDGQKKNWREYSSVKQAKREVKKLQSGQAYQFRVKACNGGFCSKFTTWNAFKTAKE